MERASKKNSEVVLVAQAESILPPLSGHGIGTTFPHQAKGDNGRLLLALPPMDVTTKQSQCDPRVEHRQLEVALEHARTAGLAAAAGFLGEGVDASDEFFVFIEVRYPSYRFREALRSLRLPVGLDGSWMVLSLKEGWGKRAQENAAKAACAVMRHYYPEEEFALCWPANQTAVTA